MISFITLYHIIHTFLYGSYEELFDKLCTQPLFIYLFLKLFSLR